MSVANMCYVCLRVCVVCKHMCTHACRDAKLMSKSLIIFHFIHGDTVSHSNPELTNTASLDSYLDGEPSCAHLLGHELPSCPEIWGSKLQPSHLQSRHCNCWDTPCLSLSLRDLPLENDSFSHCPPSELTPFPKLLSEQWLSPMLESVPHCH